MKKEFTADEILSRLNPGLVVGIIGGSGLDDPDVISNRCEIEVTTPFGEPSDKLISGNIGDIECVLLARHDRKHSKLPGSINYRANIFAQKKVGVTHIIATTACGSLKEEMEPKHLVLIDSFIDRTTKRLQTFYDGVTDSSLTGICHIPMCDPFCKFLKNIIGEEMDSQGQKYHKKGTIVSIEGPRFSSKAESNMFRILGGDLINMTTCPEVVLAAEAGLPYASIAMSTDYDCWREEVSENEHVTVSSILEVMKFNSLNVTALLKKVVPKLGEIDKKLVEEAQEFVRKRRDTSFIGK